MTQAGQPEYLLGTQRVRDPEETLAWVAPLTKRCGITRVLDITHLDRIGIPTYNAVRPNGLVLSISNGKGLTKAAATVSAIMESIEIEHAEYPSSERWLMSTSARELKREARRPINPTTLIRDCLWPRDDYEGLHYSEDLILDWVVGHDLIGGCEVILPASTVYVLPPYTRYFTSNGLASGNTTDEANLHAICELIERDAIAKVTGRTADCQPAPFVRIALDSLPEHLLQLAKLIDAAGIQLFLFNLPCVIDIYAFWAIFYCPGEPMFILSTSTGYGCHTHPVVAASRAVTEAAQARLAHIHGAREDLGVDHVNRQLSDEEQLNRSSAQARAFGKFKSMPTMTWSQMLEMRPHKTNEMSVSESLQAVLGMLDAAGMHKVFMHDLTKPEIGVPVVRIFVPGLKLNARNL
jgi:ribosomal protein S12 methylthiotransferase accessory factor